MNHLVRNIAQYEASQELPDRLFDCLTRMAAVDTQGED